MKSTTMQNDEKLAGKNIINNPGALLLRASLVVVLLFSSLPIQSAFSQTSVPENPDSPDTTWVTQPIDAPPWYVNMTGRALAFTDGGWGQPCVVYGGDGLFYSCQNTTTGVWTTVTIDSSTGAGEYAALSFDDINRAFVSYYDSYNETGITEAEKKRGHLKLAYYNTSLGQWEKCQVPAPEPVPLNLENIEPVEAVYGKYFKTPSGVDWDSPLLKPAAGWLWPNIAFQSIGVGKHTSIDVDVNRQVHISYFSDLDGDLWYANYKGYTFYDPINPTMCDAQSFSFTRVDSYNDQGRVGLWSSIAAFNFPDKTVEVHISYMSEKYDDLKYALRKPNGGWIEPITVDGLETRYDVGSFSSIGIDMYGDAHISYLDFTNYNLKYAKLTISANYRDINIALKVVDSFQQTGWFTSIAVEAGGTPHISYYNATAGDLKYYDGKNTKVLVQGTGEIGLYTSIAFGSGGPGVVYLDHYNGKLYYIKKSASGWGTPSLISGLSRDVGIATSLAISTNGMPYISYGDTSAGLLKMAQHFGPPGWATKYVMSSPHSGNYSSIQVYGDFFPRIAFYNIDNQDLMYAEWTGSQWIFHSIDRTEDVGQYISMDLDSDGYPHMSYYDATNQNLVYATWDLINSRWMTNTLDSAGNVGLYTSITLDSSNRPYISYYDATNGDLKYAYRTQITGAWELRTVDRGAPLVSSIDECKPQGAPGGRECVGWYSSIALDGAYRPRISYYDVTNQSLKLAACNDPLGCNLVAGESTWGRVTLKIDPTRTYDYGKFSSMDRDPVTGDLMHIAFLEANYGTLRYIRFQNLVGVLEDQTVDNNGSVGWYCSLKVNSAGKPAISYYDNTRGNLKFATDTGFVYPNLYKLLYLPVVSKP